jgi:hypothetical protein
MATYKYNNNGPVSGATTYTFPGASGLFLASVGTVPLGTGSTMKRGTFMQYGQTKTRKTMDDTVVWLPLGRSKAVAEVGMYSFMSFDISYRWPTAPRSYDTVSTTTPAALEANIDGLISDQHNGYLCMIQTSQMNGADPYTLGFNYWVGLLYNVQIEYLTNPAGWYQFSASFAECGQ